MTVERLIIVSGNDDRVMLGKYIDDRRLHMIKVLVLINEHEVVPLDGFRGIAYPQISTVDAVVEIYGVVIVGARQIEVRAFVGY